MFAIPTCTKDQADYLNTNCKINILINNTHAFLGNLNRL